MEIKADSLYSQLQALASEANGGIPQNQLLVTNPSSQNFGDMLKDALGTVSDMGWESRDAQRAFEMGDPNLSMADVMITKEKAGIAFEATVQVRNKVLEAYKTIMNMPV
ncbi:flagellar hook-basal body complex protein FliE [Lacimicrobium alkaliphilum]|uniref:Flagellar hook-basal body complex protein FliE n=1 Tax=Lacimicrobium alkaliphilum TaxID=1526571 RepID=A0ABQ1RM00_9ALTE|nr:flagellar hook-basal body complex protein FliE [Lacimicrobium alkaliphilum]GGD72738.1 flagellar hook-basal body complex protein FliE [Lacimicrobium alkaliphilum]